MKPPRTDRRGFLIGAGALAAGATMCRAPAALKRRAPNEMVRLGFIGVGGRGMGMLGTLGYAHPDPTRGREPLSRLDAVEVVAVCDAYDDHLDLAATSVKEAGGDAARYTSYRQMLDEVKLDAVVIATPDHLHVPITIAAMQAGCDVYVEKCMTNSLEELDALREAKERTGRILQVGHQHRQHTIRRAAREVIRKGSLGRVTLVQSYLSRPEAWTKPARRGVATRKKIHWQEFLGPAPAVHYEPNRFFNWRQYWDYSTGIAGDLMSHELDTIHYVLGLGEPASAVASGGIYYWKDKRETPDTLTVVLEYPDHDLSVMYSANLHNSYHHRPTVFLGDDATMALDWELRVFPDANSKRYAEELAQKKVVRHKPMLWLGRRKGEPLSQTAAVSELWLESEGVLTTSRDGRILDTSRLNHEELYQCMRTRREPSCGFDAVYGPTVATHLSVLAYKSGRKMLWDREKRRARPA